MELFIEAFKMQNKLFVTIKSDMKDNKSLRRSKVQKKRANIITVCKLQLLF